MSWPSRTTSSGARYVAISWCSGTAMKRGREEESSPVTSGDREPAAKDAKKIGSCDIEAANNNTFSRKTVTNNSTSPSRAGHEPPETKSAPEASSTKPVAADLTAGTGVSRVGTGSGARAGMGSGTGAGSGSATGVGGRGGAEAVKGGAVEAPDEPLANVEGTPNETLFVGNLSYRVSEAVIIKLFTPFGKVVREQFCYHMTGPRRGEPRGFCFVEYSNVDDAAKAIRALHGRKLYGRPLRVRFMTVEGQGRMDYSTSDGKGGARMGGSSLGGDGGGAKIPPANQGGGEAGAAAAGVTRLSLDKKVALLKLKLRESAKTGT